MAKLSAEALFGGRGSSGAGAFKRFGAHPHREAGPGTGPGPQPGGFQGLFRGAQDRDPRRIFRKSGPEPERGYYISGDRLADFVSQFDKAVEREEADPQFLRAWAALMDFEGAQRTEMRGALDWISPEFRFWSTFGIAGLYLVLKHLKRIERKSGKRTAPGPHQQAQKRKAEAEAQPHPRPQSGKPAYGERKNAEAEAEAHSKAVCEICDVDLIPLDERSAVCPSCNQIYRR